MQVIHSLEEIGSIEEEVHLALGVFDGVHVGHQAVIQSAVDAAEKNGGVAGVLTFDPHPIQVLAPHVAPRRILASLQHKQELLEALGVEVLLVVPFTEAFAELHAMTFLDKLHTGCRSLQTLAMGEDWKFGSQRSGNVALLREFGEKHSINIQALSAVMIDGERVSSTRIRQAIRDGNLDSVATMLGREYNVLGTVVKGQQLGRTIGFPTANLRVHNEQLPPNGVWAVDVTLESGDVYRGAGNLGVRPTVEGEEGRKLLEIYLIDYEGDLYGRDVTVRFIKHVREELKFDSLEALKSQIARDVEVCKTLESS